MVKKPSLTIGGRKKTRTEKKFVLEAFNINDGEHMKTFLFEIL